MSKNRVFLALSVMAALAATAAETSKPFTPMQRRLWSLQPVEKPAAPAAARNPIDAFVAAKLAEKKLTLSPEASKITLLRRVTLDLTGLVPTPEEAQAFLADESPAAYEKAVDRLLASPRYGERWGRHWLDLARYADSEGFKADETRPNIWRYRDYVIDSFNADKPYDRFVKEQIAGDELYPGDDAALVATGFNRHFPDESNARNIAQRRQELLNDVTDTVGSVFLGLTYGCARCHDHKFDPILHKDYYRLQAFFANTRIEDSAQLISAADRAAWQKKQAVWEERTKPVRDRMAALVKPMQESLWKENFDKFPAEIQDSITLAPEKRTPFQWQMYYKVRPQVEFPIEEAAKKFKGAEAKRWKELSAELAAFDAIKPEPLPVAQAMIDHGAASPKTHVLAGGAYDGVQEEVQPGFLSILDPSDAKFVPVLNGASSGRRAALANWLASPANPLTARVMVNRVWHYHFGRGIAATPSDFGVMGEKPTHRELLDWLAATFIEDGWSVKKLHKRILLSDTYRQSSAMNEAAAAADPENKLLWRFAPRRLEGEVIRDAMLEAAGLLNAKMGGPGVFPPMPAGVETRGGWKKNEDPLEANRRSVYVFVRRNTRYPMFEAFDFPDTHESCARRNQTLTAPQALELLNNELVFDWAKAFAARVANDGGLTAEAQVDRAWKLAFARAPKPAERESALRFLSSQAGTAGSSGQALVDLCHMLLNANEFVYLN